MNIQEINKILFSQAKGLRMCDAIHKEWYGKSFSATKLFEMYFKNIDFCLDYHWPNVDAVRDMFDVGTLRENGILANDQWSLLNQQWVAVLGESTAKVRYNAMNVGTIYVCDTSRADISVKGKAFVIIHAYDDATINVACERTAKATVLKHSKYVKVHAINQVTIKECS